MSQVGTELADIIGVQPHRVAAHVLFDDAGLSPYWALTSQFEPDLADRDQTFPALGREFEIVRSSFWEGQLDAPPQATFDGGMNEYKLAAYAADDPHNEAGADFTFRPGFPNATHTETGDPIGGLPTDCPESIRVQVEATNLSQFEILSLLQSLASHLKIDGAYFTGPHEWSSIYGLEAYVRIARERAVGQIAGKGGVLEHTAQFSIGRGRGEHKWDHEEITGHYEAVSLSPENWARLIPEQTLAKRLKCYQPEYVRSSENADDPLYDHKIEVQHWADYYPGDESLDWYGYDAAMTEFRETISNALHWAGLDVSPGADHWTADEYFDVDQADEAVELYPNPMPDLEQQSRADASDRLAGPDTTEAEWDVLVAMTDGGEAQDYHELSEAAGRSSSTVYRVAEKFDDIVTVENGTVRFRDGVVRDQIAEIAERWRARKDATVEAIRRVAEKANPFSRRSDDGEPSALERWANRHGVVVHSTGDPLELEVPRPTSLQEILKLLRAGIDAAEASPTHTERFTNALVDWTGLDGELRKDRQVVVDGALLGKHDVDRAIW